MINWFFEIGSIKLSFFESSEIVNNFSLLSINFFIKFLDTVKLTLFSLLFQKFV